MHTTNSYNRRIFQYPLVLLILTVALLALRPEVPLYFSSRYLGGAVGDPGLYIWLVESFIANPLRSLQFESLAMYPYPKTVAWSDNFFLPSGLAYALTKIGLSSIEAYNFVVCSALVLNGFVAFLVGRFIKLSIPSSIGTAISVEFSSVLMGNLGHPQLIFFFWLPLIVLPWCLEVPIKRWLFLSGIALSCSFYCSVYYSIFGAVAVFALMPIALFRWEAFSRW